MCEIIERFLLIMLHAIFLCLLSPVDNEFTRTGLMCRISDHILDLLNYNLCF